MPSWTDSLKNGQGFVRGISFRDSNSKYIKYPDTPRGTGWKTFLNDAGAGLRRGPNFKKEKDRVLNREFPKVTPCIGYINKKSPEVADGHVRTSLDTLTRLQMNSGTTSIVHGIPCIDLPLPTPESNNSESSLWEPAKWRRSLKQKKNLKISLPQLLSEDEDKITLIPPPIEKDEKYLSPQSVHFEFVTSATQYTVRDISPLIKSSTGKMEYDPFEESEPSPRAKSRYPGMTKIPDDLPCHERYIPLTRSRSTRVLESQKARSLAASAATDENEEEDVWSDSSSIYSQESIEIQVIYESYSR
jgi:hypothetical protein